MDTLRKGLHLPKTKIQTDSYIAVQLIEQRKALNFGSLKYMAEQVEGSFTFTVLDRRDLLYIVKGDNPLCLLHFPSLGLYLYASTEEILRRAISQMDLDTCKSCRIPLDCGEILRIGRDGALTRSQFDDYRLFARWRASIWDMPYRRPWEERELPAPEDSYLEEVRSVASAFGYLASGNTSPTASSIPRHLSPTMSFTPSRPRPRSYWKKLTQLALSSFMPSAAPKTSRYPSSLTAIATRMATFSNSPPQLRRR